MSSVNKVILVGNLGADPETNYLPSGDAVTNLRVATSEKWKDKGSGEMKEATEWHRVVFFGRLAEVAGEYLKKGAKIYVEGKLKTRQWEKDGQKHYSTEVHGFEMKMLSGRQEGEGGGGGYAGRDSNNGGQQRQQRPAQQGSGQRQQSRAQQDMDDDIPF